MRSFKKDLLNVNIYDSRPLSLSLIFDHVAQRGYAASHPFEGTSGVSESQ